jgi:hypothetical protein
LGEQFEQCDLLHRTILDLVELRFEAFDEGGSSPAPEGGS